MNLIAFEPHFWELYQDFDHYYLSIAVDMGSVVSCWDVELTHEEVQQYEHRGRVSIQELAKEMVAATYRGDFSSLESRLVKPYERQAMQAAFKTWQQQQQAE